MRGDGTVYQRGKRWWISYWAHGRNFRESAGTTEHKARGLLRRRLGEIAAGAFVDPQLERATVAEVLDAYLANRRLAGKRGLENIKQRCGRLKESWGMLRAIAVTLPRLEAWANERITAGHARGTVKVDLAYLRAAYRHARRAGVIARIPDFPTIEVDNARQGFFERETFEAVRDALRVRGPHGPVLAEVATFAYLSGWRIQEILDLPWAHVDRRERLIVLPSTGSTKRRRDRTLPLDYRLPGGEWAGSELWLLMERRWQARIVNSSLCPWVFHRRGKPIRDFRHGWKKACQAANVVGRIPHDLRRTRVRDLVNSGVPEKVAMEWTGHQTREVFDRYHIVTAEDQRRALAAVEAKERQAAPVRTITKPVQPTGGRSASAL